MELSKEFQITSDSTLFTKFTPYEGKSYMDNKLQFTYCLPL